MTAQPGQLPLEQVVNNMRDNILRSNSQASTASITSFDQLVEQLKIFAAQINDKNVEVLRLQELCKKNNIDFAIAPQKTVQVPKSKPATTKP